jgi:hypothetical protein
MAGHRGGRLKTGWLSKRVAEGDGSLGDRVGRCLWPTGYGCRRPHRGLKPDPPLRYCRAPDWGENNPYRQENSPPLPSVTIHRRRGTKPTRTDRQSSPTPPAITRPATSASNQPESTGRTDSPSPASSPNHTPNVRTIGGPVSGSSAVNEVPRLTSERPEDPSPDLRTLGELGVGLRQRARDRDPLCRPQPKPVSHRQRPTRSPTEPSPSTPRPPQPPATVNRPQRRSATALVPGRSGAAR